MPGHRASLGPVGPEQTRWGPAPDGGGQLPHQVVYVGHAGVEPETARRREPVGGVARQEDPALAVPLGDLAGHAPRADVLHLHVDVPGAHRGAEERGTALGRVGGQVLGGRVPLPHQHPGRRRVVGHEHADGVGVHDPVEGGGPVGHQMAEVGGDVHHHEVRQDVGTLHGDPQRRPDPAAGAVGRQHVPAPHRGHRSRVDVAQGARDPVGVLGRSGPLDAVDERVDVVPQDGLEPVLRQVAQRGRRHPVELVDAVLALEGDASELVAHQRGDPPHPRTLGRVLAGGQDPFHVDAGGPQDLEGPGVGHVGGRGGLGTVPSFDHHVVDPLAGEEHRRHQPHRAAAHHQHRGPRRQARHRRRRAGSRCGHQSSPW